MAYDAGTAHLTVVPSFRNIESELRKIANRIGGEFNKAFGQSAEKGVSEAVQQASRSTSKDAKKAGEDVGRELAAGVNDAFERNMRSALARLQRDLPDVRIGADQSRFNRAIAQARRLVGSLGDKQIGVDIDESVVLNRLQRIRALFDQISRGRRTAVQVRVDADQAVRALDRFLEVLRTRSDETARRAADAFNREFDQVWAENERRSQQAARESEESLATLTHMARQIREEAIAAQHDAFDAALKDNEKFERDFLETLERAQRENAKITEEVFDASWAGRVRKKLEDAVKSIPKVPVQVDTADSTVALQSIRDEMQDLSLRKIGIDVDTAEALAQIRGLEAELGFLARNDPDIQVRVDAVAAGTQLRLIREEVEKLDGRTAKIDVDGSGLAKVSQSGRLALSRLEQIIAVSLSLGTVLVPAAAAAASAVGFIATAAAASAAGIGAVVLGFSGIAAAVKALDKFEQDANESAASLARSNLQVAGAAQAIESAERSLDNVRASNASAARRAARAVADAQRGVVDAVRGVQDAEENLARAQVAARQSQLDLTRAREAARRALQDMDFDVRQLALDQRQATLDQEEAKKRLDALLANPRATKAQRDQARITYEEIGLRIERLAVQQERLTADQAAANRAGVEGSDRVVAAKQRVADANQRVADAQDRIRDANERVAQAQRRVADAVAAQADQQRQAAFSVAQAQQAVANAHRQAAAAAVAAGTAGGAALDNLNDAMRNLSPTAQRFARSIFGLKDEVLGLRAAAADNLLPGVQSAIERMLPDLPKFRDFMARSARAVGDLFDETSKLLSTDATWRRFFSNVDRETVPTLERLWRIGRNVSTALVGIVNSLDPFNDDIGGGLERLTERFARWATTLDQNQSFQDFLAYVRENGPRVVELVGELTKFVVRFITAAAPVGSLVTRAFIALFEVLNLIPTPVLTVIAGGIALIALSLSIMALRARAAELATRFMAGLSGVVNRLSGSFTGAATQSTNFSTSLGNVGVSAGTTKKGLGGLSSFLGGPWGVALAGATAAVLIYSDASAKQRRRNEELRDSLRELADAFHEEGSASAQAVQELVRRNERIRDVVLNSDRYGVAVERIVDGLNGEQAAQEQVTRALDAHMEALEAEADEIARNSSARDHAAAKAIGSRFEEIERTRELEKALQQEFDAKNEATAATDILARATRRLHPEQATLSGAFTDNAAKIRVLQGLVDAFGSAEATAADRVNALRAAVDLQTGAAISAIEADERFAQSLVTLRDQVKNAKAAHEEGAKSLDLNTAAGLRNRDAIEDAALAARDLYLQDIASGVPMEEATKRHEDRIDALQGEADKAGLSHKKTSELIKKYGEVPDNVTTVMDTKGFDQVWEELAQLKFIQDALAKGIPVEKAKRLFKIKQWMNAPSFFGPGGPAGDGPGVVVGFDSGGRVHGPGTSTSDSILARVSNGEFVEPTSSVDYYGQGFMEALRRRLIPRDLLPRFATGGRVDLPFPVDLSKTFTPTLDDVVRSVIPAVSAGGIGSADMMRILRRFFPGLALYSGYRPGSRTASGSLSYHAMFAADGDPGRAVDVPPRRDVFDWIHEHYMRQTRELIWLGEANRNIWNGRHHRFSNSLLRQHGVAGMPNAHIHWAMDSGGMLEPGWNPPIWNGTGRPEPVLTDQQWRQISRAARGGDSPYTVNQFTFRDTTLTPELWQAMQDRQRAQDALDRVGRPK